MSSETKAILSHRPSYVMNANGEPEAVLIDLPTWRIILKHLENVADQQILRQAINDLERLAKGDRPTGWQSWEEFEAELDTLEQTGELPD